MFCTYKVLFYLLGTQSFSLCLTFTYSLTLHTKQQILGLKCEADDQRLQFLDRPLEADSKMDLILIHRHVKN